MNTNATELETAIRKAANMRLLIKSRLDFRSSLIKLITDFNKISEMEKLEIIGSVRAEYEIIIKKGEQCN